MITQLTNTQDIAIDKTKEGISGKSRAVICGVAALALQACASSGLMYDRYGNPIPSSSEYAEQKVDQFGNPIPLQGETDTQYLERQNNGEVIVNNGVAPIYELRASAHKLAQLEGESCKINTRQANFNTAQESYEDCRDNIASIPSITTQEQANVRHKICVITANQWLENANIEGDASCAVEACKIEASMMGVDLGWNGGKCKDGELFN